MPTRIASDGLRARENGEWAVTKLLFLDRFGPTAIDATRRKHNRVFVDLFAGPGMNIDPRSEGEPGAIVVAEHWVEELKAKMRR